MDTTAAWLELSFDATAEAVDWVRSLLTTTTYAGVVQLKPYVAAEPHESANRHPWAFTIYLYLPNNTQVRSQLDAIAQQLSPLHRTGLTSELQTALRETRPAADMNPTAHRVGQRFVVQWLAGAEDGSPDVPEPQATDDIVLMLPPSLAFGSGLHPATVLSLRLLERYVQPTMSTLDLGCGSGILSVAIAKLGAQVLALDNDAIAVDATEAAVQQNGVASQVTVKAGSLGSGSQMGHWMGGAASEAVAMIQPAGSFDLIAANILARVHIALAPEFRRALRRQDVAGGMLVAAGFTAEYEADVAAAFVDAGFEAVGSDRLDEWVALVYRVRPE